MNPEGANKDKVESILQASLHGDPKSSSHGYKLCNTQEPLGDLTDNHELFFSSANTKEACAQGLWNGEFSLQFSELQACQEALESHIQRISDLEIQLGQCFDYGDCKVRLRLSATTWRFAVCTDYSNQCQPFQDKKGK
ncbi:neuroblastoma breakpoint family member 4-like isoform X2 [Octodon degus]|uniref:Neuroblastoma breakpoint family member 4-like isoform X2 n=1 Tax=Octodon degus TaxID=10160 RepID=A0A6P6DX59_OCTDE|nr:neuroblastoma breakpoint family member 4-like isoform X2 [Octodon degus]